MTSTSKKNKIGTTVIAIIAVLFGAMTIKEGGSVLFWSETARTAAGNFVPFVLWFNFLAGFFYIFAGIGLFMRRRWSAKLAALIAALTVLVFIAFILFIITNGAFETRTVIAMTMRNVIWLSIASFAHAFLMRRRAYIK